MKRRLRIAVSVFFALMAVVLCGLWVRSYSQYEMLVVPVGSEVDYDITSDRGTVYLRRLTNVPNEWDWPYYVNYNEFVQGRDDRTVSESWDLDWDSDGNAWLTTPYWFWVLATATVSILQWARTRMSFSLRTMLIATTLVAVVLGLAVWAGR
jgi:hypothetical protein